MSLCNSVLRDKNPLTCYKRLPQEMACGRRALYQGTASAVPSKTQFKSGALAPAVESQGLNPILFTPRFGTTEVVP